MNVRTIKEKATFNAMFTPRDLMQHIVLPFAHRFKHYANLMLHPVTGETISSYKKLMHNPATADIWQTAFGKDFGGMSQGHNKMGQKGTNAMFFMTHEEIQHMLQAGKKITYANPVVDRCPQKEDANQIQITPGGNLINYNEELSVPTADLVTAKLYWNSVVITAWAKYTCIDIFFFTQRQSRILRIHGNPLALFPDWIIDQYDLKRHALDGKVHLKLRHAVWG
jgi:hypothetical protein